MDAMSATPRAQRPTVVILEDDHGVRRSLQLLLRAKTFDVKAFASADALLADPTVMSASCLIADYHLAETDGIAVLETLRIRGWAGPALLVTAFGSPALERQAKAAGFCEVLHKPLKEHALVSSLAKVMA